MNTTNFLKNARRALMPMRKATGDAILLTITLTWLIALTGVIFSFPWLIIVIFTLTLGGALMLRLRQYERQMKVGFVKEQSMEQTIIWLMSFWGRLPLR